jgi:hypothetical protein
MQLSPACHPPTRVFLSTLLFLLLPTNSRSSSKFWNQTKLDLNPGSGIPWSCEVEQCSQSLESRFPSL